MLITFREAYDVKIVPLYILSEEFVLGGIGVDRVSAVVQ